MATLIQSKQIEGIVTSSVIHGEFLVSGSLVVTGSNSILGAVTASAISSSFFGDGSNLTGITYSQIDNTPQFVGGNNITITSSSNVITVHAQLDGTGSDAQSLSISGDQLTILGGNTITIPTGSGVSDYTQLTNVPSGIISGSSQITITQSQISDLSHTDISLLNTFSSSIQSEVDSLTAATSSYLTELPSGVISGSAQLPSGVISGSSQITITESQISDLSHYTDSDVKTKLNTEGVLSGSLIEQLPSGVISGSSQVTITESQISDLSHYTDSDVKTKLDAEGVISGSSQITITQSQISDLSHTDISALNTFSSSIQSEVDSLTSATSSYLTTVPSGTISGSEQLPQGLISGSSQITITESQISDLSHYTNSDVQSYIDSIGVVSGSVVAELPTGVISGSSQITITQSQISDLDHYTDSDVKTKLDTEGVISGSLVSQLPSGVVSGSSQITITESQISDLTHYTDSDVKAKLDAEGVVSGSYVQSLPSGVISGSSQITITESQISDLSHYGDSDVKTKLDSEGVLSGSLVEQLPSGVISGSSQLPDGVISGSSQITITESQISDLSHYSDSDVKTKLDVEGVISGSSQVISALPSGTISGSTQITDGSGLVSSSAQVIQHLPEGVISGSTYTEFSSSVSESIDALQVFSSSAYQSDSSSIDRRLDGLEGGAALYYDLSNTVLNNKYIKSGSGEISDTSNFQTGNRPFRLRFNQAAKLAYELNDVVYITNFDRDTVIHAIVSSSYETASLEAGFTVLDVNGETDSTRINDSYWIVTKHSGGFITSASYGIDSASFDYRIDGIVASGSGADWNVNLYNIPDGIISSSEQQYSASIQNGFALTSSLNQLDTKIDNVFLSSSNFDNKGLFSGSSQVDLRNVTNYVSDEHIDHTTVTISAGDGLVGGGDIASSRTISLNNTSSYFQAGVQQVLDDYGFPLSTTYTTDSASFDTRIDNITAGSVPAGTVSGSSQVDIEQTTNYTSFSSSIATSIAGVSGGTTDISNLNTFTSSADTRITNLENFSSSLDTDFATDVELTNLSSSLSASIYEAAQSGSGVSSWNELSDIPSGILSGSAQIASDISGSFTSLSQSLDTRITTEKDRIDNILSGANADYDQFVEIVDLVNSTDTTNDIAFANHYSSSRQRLSSLESFTGSLDATYATDTEVTNLSSSLSQSIYEAAQSGSGVSSWNELTDIPEGIVSGSSQLTASYDTRYALSGSLVSSNIDTGSFATTGSNTFSGSQFLTGSIIPEASGGNGLHDLGSTSNPFRELYITTGSVRFVKDGNVISQVSGERDAIRVGNILITTSSLQIVNNAGNVVSTIAKANRGVGGDVSTTEQVLLPDGVVSGSSQLTSSYDERYLTSASFLVDSASFDTRIDGIAAGNVPDGTISSSAQILYDGNRVISNEDLGDLFTNAVNPGTSGSVIDFLNAVFYPNTGPSISTGNQTIAEYVESGSSIVTLSGTDPEGQAITFGTASDYTDDLVRVESGVLKLNALAESSSFNTDLSGGSHGHQVTVTATDTFGTVTEKDIFVFVTPNSTPVFRETSVAGNVITSVTANLNENSANDTLVKRVYFTDANGDSITITTSSIDNEHFDVAVYSNYLDIRQNTSSLDYEQQTTYNFSVSASDEHYEAGQDSDSIVTLPITVNVTDNLTPTLNNQTLSSINENSSNGATVGTISAADNEGDTITFKNFELHQLQLDGSGVTSGSYSGTSQLTDPHENPFQMSTSGVVTRKTGVYLNSDIINTYIYRAQVTDSYNGDSDVALITINITDDTPATISDNWSAGPYIKESEESGTTIKTTNYGSTIADYGSNQSGTWSSSNSAISINSNGNLSLGVDLSGSVTQSGDTLDSTITFTNTFGTTTTDSLSVTIVGNSAPTANFSNSGLTGNYNTNLATDGTALLTSTVSDTEGDTPYQMTIGGTNGSSFTAVPQNSDSSSWQIQANGDLSAGSYSYDVTVTDSYSETTTYSRSLTIAQGDTGTLGGDTTSYIIESAESGDSLRDATGYNQGNTSQLSVSYTNYGSPTVQSYTSSNEAFNIDTSGNITLGLDISGSSTGSGDTISSDITFVDQYGNIGSGSLTVNVFANGAPTATFTNNSSVFNANQATSGTKLVDVSITDTESDTPYAITIGGTSSWAITPAPQNAVSSSWELQVTADTSSLAAGTYTYDVTVSDNFGKSTTYSDRTFTIAAADTGDLVATDAYIIESAVSGDLVRRNSNGRTGTQSSVAVSYSPNYGSQSATNFASSNALIDIDSAGRLSVGNDISGSGSTNGSIIATTITWNDQYGNNGSEAISVDVTQNFAPTVSSTSTSNLNTNQATGSSLILRLNLTDTESDTINASGLSWTGYNSTYFTPSNTTGQMNLLVNSTSVPAGEYDYTASIEDVHGFSTNVVSGSYTIAQADDGTLGGDTSIYIIESAESGDVFRDQTGYNAGNAAQVSVSYSPSYGSPVVTEFTSSRQGISVDSSGNLTAGYDFSGSVTSTDYTSTALTSDSTNSTLYDKSLHVNGIKVVQGAATGSQSAVPDAFTEKVAQMIKLMVTSSGADINDTDQANMIGILKGETGTWHSGYPTAQRILRGAGSDYSPNPLNDSNYSSYPGLQDFQDSHSTDDMVWYLNSTGDISGSGDNDAQEVIEHLMHTIHLFGVRGAVSGSFNGLSWDPDTDSNWNTRELYYAIKEAVDDSVFDISDYGDGSYNTAATYRLITKEYLYLLNFNMWEYSSLWSGSSLSPEWNDNSRTPSGIQTNNPLGYALYNNYIKPVLTKPSLTTIRSIFQDGDLGDPTGAGSSGYTPEVGTGLISKITFRDQYDNIGSGSVTATVFGNSSPAASFTSASNYDTDASVSGSTAGTLTVTDTENNSPFVFTLAGTDGGKFNVAGSSSPFTIQPTGSLEAGTYSINITVTDNYGESVTLTNESIVVDAAEVLTNIYVYTLPIDGTYSNVNGITANGSGTPPSPTIATTYGFFTAFVDSDTLGDSTITVSYGTNYTATRRAVVSGSNVDTALDGVQMSIGSSERAYIMIPSGSDTLGGVPTSLTTSDPGSSTTAGEYVLFVANEDSYQGSSGGLSNDIKSANIHKLTLDTAVDGYTDWFVIGTNDRYNAGNSTLYLRLVPSSGSVPS